MIVIITSSSLLLLLLLLCHCMRMHLLFRFIMCAFITVQGIHLARSDRYFPTLSSLVSHYCQPTQRDLPIPLFNPSGYGNASASSGPGGNSYQGGHVSPGSGSGHGGEYVGPAAAGKRVQYHQSPAFVYHQGNDVEV